MRILVLGLNYSNNIQIPNYSLTSPHRDDSIDCKHFDNQDNWFRKKEPNHSVLQRFQMSGRVFIAMMSNVLINIKIALSI